MNAAANSELNSSTMLALLEMMHEINPFVEYFKTMADMDVGNRQSSSDTISRDIRMIFRAENTPDSRRYNAPTAAEIGVLIVGGDGDRRPETEPTNRDIAVRLKGDDNILSHIKETNQFYDLLQYVLMFPQGTPGRCCGTLPVAPNINDIRINNADTTPYFQAVLRNPIKKITMMDFYSSMLMIR
ncbi:hypothetical protein A0J61_09775 [Choanephora cucurbitarum]|uniref:Helitron helicase-like domain-containing protein n=1 Tax=Choanephora cucurbitarum TaxID=101091 RepID=A0A1C7N0I7_9FUNG|nr:hypothetical protein A0J61_09775 [Choanephora cucurbitarum]